MSVDAGALDVEVWAHWAHMCLGVLAAVFAVSGLSKLAAPSDAALAMLNFGVTKVRSLKAARALGGMEVVLATGLLGPFWVARLAWLAVLAALTAFTALVLRSLSRGERFECACFGVGRSKIGPVTVGRNLLLCMVWGVATTALGSWSYGTDGASAVATGAAFVGISSCAAMAITLRPQQRQLGRTLGHRG